MIGRGVDKLVDVTVLIGEREGNGATFRDPEAAFRHIQEEQLAQPLVTGSYCWDRLGAWGAGSATNIGSVPVESAFRRAITQIFGCPNNSRTRFRSGLPRLVRGSSGTM